MGNDIGTGAAATESPSALATPVSYDEDPAEGNFGLAEDSGEDHILKQFDAMLLGIRALPRHLRARARREAADWLRGMFKARQERRAIERYARHQERRRKMLLRRPRNFRF